MSISLKPQIVHRDDKGYCVEFFDDAGLRVFLSFQGLNSKVRSIWTDFQNLYIYVVFDTLEAFSITMENKKAFWIDERRRTSIGSCWKSSPIAISIINFLSDHNLLEQGVAGRWREVCQLENKA